MAVTRSGSIARANAKQDAGIAASSVSQGFASGSGLGLSLHPSRSPLLQTPQPHTTTIEVIQPGPSEDSSFAGASTAAVGATAETDTQRLLRIVHELFDLVNRRLSLFALLALGTVILCAIYHARMSERIDALGTGVDKVVKHFQTVSLDLNTRVMALEFDDQEQKRTTEDHEFRMHIVEGMASNSVKDINNLVRNQAGIRNDLTDMEERLLEKIRVLEGGSPAATAPGGPHSQEIPCKPSANQGLEINGYTAGDGAKERAGIWSYIGGFMGRGSQKKSEGKGHKRKLG